MLLRITMMRGVSFNPDDLAVTAITQSRKRAPAGAREGLERGFGSLSVQSDRAFFVAVSFMTQTTK
jgi:hypothetical protein